MYREEWKEVVILVAEIYAFGAFVYIILGEGRRQGGPEEKEEI